MARNPRPCPSGPAGTTDPGVPVAFGDSSIAVRSCKQEAVVDPLRLDYLRASARAAGFFHWE